MTLLIAVLALAVTQPKYTVQTFEFYLPQAMNNKGQIICNIMPGQLWDGKKLVVLPKEMESVEGINDSGTIIGSQLLDHKDIPYQFSGGIITRLMVLDGDSSARTSGINSGGTIVGLCKDAYRSKPVFWLSGEIHVIDIPVDFEDGYATAVNDDNWIIGSFYTKSRYSPFLYREGKSEFLSLPEGVMSGEAVAINKNGVIVGHYTKANTYMACRWIDKKPVALGKLVGSEASEALSVNKGGDIVGRSGTQARILKVGWEYVPNDHDRNTHAILWRGADMFDLNDCVEKKPAKLVLIEARGINDSGQIMGHGRLDGDMVTFLLTPVKVQTIH